MKRALLGALLLLRSSWSGWALPQVQRTEAGEHALATQRTRILLLTGAGLDDLGARFAAELASLQFEVVRITDVTLPEEPQVLETLALGQRARAAVRVAAAENAVDLWLVNPVTHEAVYRRVVSEKDPAVAVLRLLEILRGSLVDLHAMDTEPAPAPPVLTPVAALQPASPKPKPKPKRVTYVGVSVAGTLLRARGRPAAGALATLDVALTSKLRFNADALLPLTEWQIAGQGGRVKAWALGLLVGGSVAPFGERRFTPTVGVGVGVLGLHTRGEAEAGFRGSSDLNLALFPHARLGLGVQVLPRLRVRAEISSGFALPRPVLLLGDERNGAWINPLLQGSLGLQLGWD